jgi:hypothetical protein
MVKIAKPQIESKIEIPLYNESLKMWYFESRFIDFNGHKFEIIHTEVINNSKDVIIIIKNVILIFISLLVPSGTIVTLFTVIYKWFYWYINPV